MIKKENFNSYSIKEVSIALNNCLSVVLKPVSGHIADARLRKLREYANALIEPLAAHMDGGVDELEGPFDPCVTPEEVVAILIAAALAIHLQRVARTEKVPQAEVAELLFDKESDEGK